MKRRDVIRSLAVMAGMGWTGKKWVQAANASALTTNGKHRVMRIAHLTDMHVSNDIHSMKGLEKCLHFIQSMPDRPDIIFNGGDTIDDGLYKTRSIVRAQWNAWRSVMRGNNDLPVEYCLGNHDIWGLYNPAKDASYGKSYALEMMQVGSQYTSFDRNGWHFIILDSTQKKKNGLWYTARLDEKQMAWLKADLQATPPETPVLVLSHIPILCANVFLDDLRIRGGKFSIPGSWMHTDVQDIVQLFSQHPNVKLCLSGHIHMRDAVHYNNISFYCNGAVSGDWWKNESYKGTRAGFGIVDLYADGSHENQYVSYLS